MCGYPGDRRAVLTHPLYLERNSREKWTGEARGKLRKEPVYGLSLAAPLRKRGAQAAAPRHCGKGGGDGCQHLLPPWALPTYTHRGTEPEPKFPTPRKQHRTTLRGTPQGLPPHRSRRGVRGCVCSCPLHPQQKRAI